MFCAPQCAHDGMPHLTAMVQVSRAGPAVARFSFKELCDLPLVKHFPVVGQGLVLFSGASCIVPLELSEARQM